MDRTRAIFKEGKSLARKLSFPLNVEIRMTWLGGTTILKKIESLDYDTVSKRPKLRPTDGARIVARAAFPL